MNRNEARKKVTEIVDKRKENIFLSRHAKDEMRKDNLRFADVWNVLKSADSRITEEGEIEKGSYRYRLETTFIVVVIAFNKDADGFFIVTVWDKRK